MESQKYYCSRCGELFETNKISDTRKLACPRCSSENIAEFNACNLEVVPPAWEYQCQKCSVTFQVKSPSGSDEAKGMRCPICRSKDVKWIALAAAAGGTGG